MKLQSSFSPETCGRWAGLCIGSLFSPSWPLLQAAFSPYIAVETLLSAGITPSMLYGCYAQLSALNAAVLLGHVLPMLLIILITSMGYLLFCGWLGQRIARYATDWATTS